jgi:hypothetical protein
MSTTNAKNPKIFFSGPFTAAGATLYTVPAGTNANIKQIRIASNVNNDTTVNIIMQSYAAAQNVVVPARGVLNLLFSDANFTPGQQILASSSGISGDLTVLIDGEEYYLLNTRFSAVGVDAAQHTLFTVPANEQYLIKHIRIANSDGSPHGMQLSIGPLAAPLAYLRSNGNGDTVPAGGGVDMWMQTPVNTGEIFQYQAGAVGVMNITVDIERKILTA